jgi:hypothetical protein
MHPIDDSHREAAAGVGSVQLHLQRFVFRVIARVGPEGARIGCHGEIFFGALVVLERGGEGGDLKRCDNAIIVLECDRKRKTSPFLL